MEKPIKHAGVLYGTGRMIYGERDSRLPKPKFKKVGHTDVELTDDGAMIAGRIYEDEAIVELKCGDTRVHIGYTTFRILVGYMNMGSRGSRSIVPTNATMAALDEVEKELARLSYEAGDSSKEVYRGEGPPMTPEEVESYQRLQDALLGGK